MNHPSADASFASTQSLLTAYNQLKQEQPKARARDLAHQLGVGEGALLAARVGQNSQTVAVPAKVTRLRAEPESLLKGLKPLGKLMALTRNEEVVHERKGIYDNLSFNRHGNMRMGIALNPDIDLRLFLHHWVLAFAVTETARGRTLRSLQFFNSEGLAVHKVYCTDGSDIEAYEALVERFTDQDQTPALLKPKASAKQACLSTLPEADAEAFRTAWRALKDVHEFYPLLKRFNIDRQYAFRLVQGEFTQAVEPTALQEVLDLARDQALDIMVFVGNPGCIQIHTGPVNHLMEMNSWYNVMDPDFNLHANRSGIATAWVVRKPSTDGTITSIECFNHQGESVVTFFGKRKPGIPELALWRDIVTKIETKLATPLDADQNGTARSINKLNLDYKTEQVE
jgi:putative hemin transport protein